MQDRLHLVLQPRPLPHDMRPPGDLPAQRLRRLIGDPHRRQIVRRQQLREDRGVDLVGLDLRLRDRPRLHRVGHHHPRDPRLDQLGRSRACCTSPRSRPHPRAAKLSANTRSSSPVIVDLPGLADPPVLPDRDLRELAMHIQPDTSASHRYTSNLLRLTIWESRRANDTYGSALAAHPGKSQGRPSTNTRSKRNV